jgi:hypothetical protein
MASAFDVREFDTEDSDAKGSDAKEAYRQVVRRAKDSNDPDVAFKAAKAFARRYHKTMKRLA